MTMQAMTMTLVHRTFVCFFFSWILISNTNDHASHDDPNNDDGCHVTHAIDDDTGLFLLYFLFFIFFNTKFF